MDGIWFCLMVKIKKTAVEIKETEKINSVSTVYKPMALEWENHPKMTFRGSVLRKDVGNGAADLTKGFKNRKIACAIEQAVRLFLTGIPFFPGLGEYFPGIGQAEIFVDLEPVTGHFHQILENNFIRYLAFVPG